MDEVPYIQAFWDVLTEQQRQELLTVNHQQLQQTAWELIEAVNTHPRKPMCMNTAHLSTADVLTSVIWSHRHAGANYRS